MSAPASTSAPSSKIIKDRELDQISATIDNMLSDPWTDRQYDFYVLLVSKVAEYREKARSYKEFNNDKRDIIKNICAQPWFLVSQKQDRVMELIRSMMVDTLTEDNTKYYQFNLKLRLSLSPKIYFVIQYDHKREENRFRIYYTDDRIKGYVVYSGHHAEEKKLPEYDKIDQLGLGLSKSDVVHLTTELLLYYDVHHNMAELPMGTAYPISLPHLSEEIDKRTV